MKKYITGFIMVVCSLLILSACRGKAPEQNKTTKVATQSIVGETYKGTHTGNKTSADPDYTYLMDFKKDGTFRQDIIASNGYAGKFVEQGKYKIDTKTKNITIDIQEVVEVTYANDDDLKVDKSPVSYQYRDKAGTTKLTDAENKPITIKIMPKYLVGSVNKVKLYQTSEKVVTFKQFKTNQGTKYHEAMKLKTKNAIVGKNFQGHLDKNDIWISFNEDGTYNWKSIYNSYGAGTVDFDSGQYHLDDAGHLSFDGIQGDIYDMSQLDITGSQYKERKAVDSFDARFNLAVYNNHLILRWSNAHGGTDADYQTPDSGNYRKSTMMNEVADKTPSYLDMRNTMKKVNPIVSQFTSADLFGRWALSTYRTPAFGGEWKRPNSFGIRTTQKDVTKDGITFAYLTTIMDVAPKDAQQIGQDELIGLSTEGKVYLNSGQGFIMSSKFTDYLNNDGVNADALQSYDTSTTYIADDED